MARLASDWVEKNFKLSRHVTMMEKDFSNGYLFAEMLLQRGLIEDDVEYIVDTNMPLDVMKNFNIMGKALKKLDITLTKKLVADIISEQPGGAAELIMQIKRALEQDNSRPVKSATITSVKSLRPRTFVRKAETLQQMSPEERFLSTTLSSSDAFCDVDMIAQIDKFFTLDIIETDKYKQNEAMAAHQREQMIAARRQKMLAEIAAKKKLREEIAAAGAKSHRAVQNVKKNRMIRDLQYELALETKADLINQMKNDTARDDAVTGIDSFEFNLKRNGLGGDDYSEQQLVPTAESTSLFMERIERDTMKHWPSNGEISDFMMNLEKRTGDLRAARLEKARRKRRMQVEQASSTSSLEVVDEHEMEDEPVEPAVDKATLKQQKIDAINERVAEARAKLAEIAEEKIKEFCEDVRQRVSDEDRAKLVEQVLVAREQKIIEKTKRNAKLCQDIISDIIDEAIGAQVVVKVSDDATEQSRDDVLRSLVELIRNRAEGSADNAVGGVGGAAQILKQCGATADLWPSVTASVLNFGTLFGRGKESFVDNSLRVTQSLLEYMSKDCLDAFPMTLSTQEKESMQAVTTNTYYLVTGQQGIARAQWEKFCSWFNSDVPLVGVWDIIDAVEVAVALKAAFDENNASVNDYAVLSKLYNIGEGINGEISAVAMRVVMDIIEYTTIITTSEMSENPSFSFTDTTLCILVAQTQWLRSHIASAYATSVGSYPIPRFVIISKCFGGSDAAPAHVGLMEWCLRGGSRLNVADDDSALQALLTDEQAAQKPVTNKKASVKSTKPKRGKADMEGVDESTSVKYILNFAGGETKSVDHTSDNATVNIVVQYLNKTPAELAADANDVICNLCTKINCDLLSMNLGSEAKEGYRTASNAFVAMESVSACVLQAASKLQPAVAPIVEGGAAEVTDTPAASAEAPIILSLHDIIAARRASFDQAQQMLIKHWTGDNILSASELVSAFNSLQFSRCCEVELLGSILAAILVKVKEFDVEISIDEAVVIEDMKTSDPRWKEFCFRYLDTLGKIESKVIVLDHERAKEQLQDYSNDLLCSMGDVIDERHRHWINKILSLHDKYKVMITNITEFIRTMTIYLGKTMQLLSDVQARAIASLGNVLQAAGYSEYPWSASSNDEASSLKSVLQQLGDIAGGNSDDLSCAWQDNISAVEGPISDNGAFTNDLTASSTCYMQFFCSTLVSLQQRNKESGEGMILKALKRNTYEHGLLKKWFHELKATFQDSYYNDLIGSSSPRRAAGTKKSTQSAPIKFLSTYYFGVSEDSEADGVELSSLAHGAVEVKDMMLPLNKVKKLAAAMIVSSHNDSVEHLSTAVKSLLDSGETLPISWRQPRKLQAFAAEFAATENVTFTQRVINTLVLSHISMSPSVNYIVKLCRAILLRHSKTPYLQDSPTFVKYTDIFAAIESDESLKKGWWPIAKKQKKKKSTDDILTPALEALAMSCVDDVKLPFETATAMVNLDRFATLLCLGPEFLYSTKIYNEYAGQEVSERVALNEYMLQTTKCKLLSVAAELTLGGNKSALPGAKALIPEITTTQVQWASKHTEGTHISRTWISVVVDDNGVVTLGSKATFEGFVRLMTGRM